MRAPFLLGSILIAATFLPATSTTPVLDTSEVGRIQSHLARAEAFAARRDLSCLTPAQRAARVRELARLAAYRRHGEFPENRVRRERTPVFVDGRGVHCAVGHLLALDGEVALVARIVAMRNCARVRELADEPELVAWLDRNGLTLEEAARIQPQYDGNGDGVIDEGPGTEMNHAYPLVAVASTMVSATGIVANLHRGETPGARSARLLYGSLVGAAGIGVGVVGFHGDDTAIGILSAGAGALSILSTLHNGPLHAKPGAPVVSWAPRWEGSRVAFLSAAF